MKVSRDTWLSESKNPGRDGLLYDMLAGLYGQPKICSKIFVKRKHVLIAGGIALGLLVGLGILEFDTIMAFIQ
jgi:hypothetical protein